MKKLTDAYPAFTTGAKDAKPLWIGEMEENDVDGREGPQAGQRIQPVWLAYLHSLVRRQCPGWCCRLDGSTLLLISALSAGPKLDTS